MIVLFGTRSRTRTLGIFTAMCTDCGGPMPHHLYRKLTRLTLFWVPTVPISVKHFTVCLGCSRTLKISMAEMERLSPYLTKSQRVEPLSRRQA